MEPSNNYAKVISRVKRYDIYQVMDIRIVGVILRQFFQDILIYSQLVLVEQSFSPRILHRNLHTNIILNYIRTWFSSQHSVETSKSTRMMLILVNIDIK